MKKNRKILFIVPFYRDRSPSQRFRIERYIDYFERNGYECTFSHLITPETDKVFYSKGNLIAKTLLLLKFLWIRLRDVRRASKYDIVFVQREAIFIGTTFFERRFAKKSKLIFDFDDAIWLPNVSEANKNLEWLKDYQKTERIIALAHYVIAGNSFLADYAAWFNPNVTVIPTTVDTLLFVPEKKEWNNNDSVCIGWSGSQTTVKHFEVIVPVLKRIKEKYGRKVSFKLIGNEQYLNDVLGIKGIKWMPDREVEELRAFDIGIMPLPDDKWAKGKCGLKGLTYMALEIPTIMSPVGVNTEIIQDGVNGFLASTEEEWIEKISLLIENPGLRQKLGKAGRQTVVEKYSVEANKQKYLEVFNVVPERDIL